MESAPVERDEARPGSKGLAQRVAGNSAWLIARPLLLNVISIASTGYIARKLGAGDYGTFNLGFAQVALFVPLCSLGLRGVAVRAVAQDREHAREIISAVAGLRLLTTLAAALLALAWLFISPYSAATRMIGVAAIASMICTACGYSPIDLFQGFERSRLAVMPQIVGGLALTGLSVLALVLGFGLAGFTVAYVLGAVLQLVLLLAAARKHYFPIVPSWDPPRYRQLLLQARAFALIGVVGVWTQPAVLDVMILAALLGDHAVGPYAAAIGLLGRLLIVPLGIGDALYPAVAHGYAQDRAEVESGVRRCFTTLALVTVPISVWLSFAAPTVLWLLFGSEYVSAAPALAVAGWLLPVAGLGYALRECLSAVHLQGISARLWALGGVLTVVLLGLLIPPFGATGAALALLGQELVLLPISALYFARQFQRPVSTGDLGRVALAGALFAAPLAAAATHYSHLGITAASFAGAALYGAAVVWLGLVDLRELPVVGRLLRKKAPAPVAALAGTEAAQSS
ncbi:MAG: flippase [Armatimonadota bacterium]